MNRSLRQARWRAGAGPCAALALLLTTRGAHGQFVPGNEALRQTVAGVTVETPPVPSSGLAAPCPAHRVGCRRSGWRMVETVQGLQECTEIYARAGACRPSRYGTEQATRLWVVKSDGRWMQCQRAQLGSLCVPTREWAVAVVQ